MRSDRLIVWPASAWPFLRPPYFDFCHFQENGNSENTVKMGKRTFLKPRPNAGVFKHSCPRIERRNFGAVKTGSFRVLGFCQKGQKSSSEDRNAAQRLAPD